MLGRTALVLMLGDFPGLQRGLSVIEADEEVAPASAEQRPDGRRLGDAGRIAAADTGCVDERFLVQVTLMRPKIDCDGLVRRMGALDYGSVRSRESVLNVQAHIDATDRAAATRLVHQRLEERLQAADRQHVVAVAALHHPR
jgi:hypothetical protein